MNKEKIKHGIAMIAGIALFHYLLPRELLSLHILFRFLYLVPVAYVAFYTGRKGGLLTALAVTVVFLPHFFMATATQEFIAGNIGAIILFFLAGFFVGNFRDVSEREILKRQEQRQIISASKDGIRSILFYSDNTQLSSAAAEWFISFFADRTMSVCLLSIYNEDETDSFPTEESAREHVSHIKTESRQHVENIRQKLISNGFEAAKIVTKQMPITGNSSISDKILDEVKEGGYDLVLLPKHPKTHTQEFMFGDTAIQVMRKASVPVLSVKGTFE
ncbi:MAG: universal stress protein [Desulfobulbaceae bacterium]|nr:universal stress protein [Desulfobulbaceae bacterium]